MAIQDNGDPAPFAGFYPPRYTQVPDALFDELLPDLTLGELKVLLYVIRRTLGFKRDSEQISLPQICTGLVTADGRRLDRGAGVALSTAQVAIKGLVAKGAIVVERHRSAERGDEASTYALRLLPGAEIRQGPVPKSGRDRYRNPVGPPYEKQKGETDDAQEDKPPVRAPRPETGAKSAPAAKDPTPATVLAERWMKANLVDPAAATGPTVVQYRKWAKDILRSRDLETITRLLRWLYSQRTARGEQYTITPAMIDQRIGQWEAMGAPATFVEKPRSTTGGRRGAADAPTPEQIETARSGQWPGVCACGRARDAKHAQGCQLGGAVKWDWYIDPDSGQAPAHVQARLDAALQRQKT